MRHPGAALHHSASVLLFDFVKGPLCFRLNIVSCRSGKVPTSGASRQARSGRDARGVIVFGYKLANDAVYALGPDRFKGLMAGLAGDLQDAEWIAKVFLSEPQRGRPPMGLEIPASLRVWPKGHDLQQSRRRSKLGLCRHKKALSALYPIGCFECVCCLSFRLLTGRRGVGGYFAARSAFLHGSFNERRARTQFAIARCVVAPSFVI